jgi:hypothetical protein
MLSKKQYDYLMIIKKKFEEGNPTVTNHIELSITMSFL